MTTAGDAALGRDPVALAQALIRCPSVTPAEGGALALLDDVLSAHGFDCHRLAFGEAGTADVENLYARIGTRAPVFLFAGHTDVVPPGDEGRWRHAPFSGDVADGALHGRGAVDMKGGIACFVAAALAHLDARGGASGSIALLITGDEEGVAVNGTRKVLDWAHARGERFDAALVGEPTNPAVLGDAIKVGRRGSVSGRIVVRGRQGHVAYPHLAANPVPGLVRALAALTAGPLDGGTDSFEPSNLEITSVDVGNPAFNVIPAEATAAFNIRFNDLHSPESLHMHINRVLRTALEGGELTGAVELLPNPSPVFLTRDDALSGMLAAAVEAETGRRPAFTTNGGTSDARYVKDYCPVVEFGLVGRTMHQVDECVPLDDLARLTAIYRRFLDAYFPALS